MYKATTQYMRAVYNKARILNRSAARLAMSVFQRRLASSSYALMRSFERRVQKLDELIRQIESGELSAEELANQQRKLESSRGFRDVFESETADEEEAENGVEENERGEDTLLAEWWPRRWRNWKKSAGKSRTCAGRRASFMNPARNRSSTGCWRRSGTRSSRRRNS